MEPQKRTIILRCFYGDNPDLKEHRDIKITDSESLINNRVHSELAGWQGQGYKVFRNMILPWHSVKEIAVLEE